MAKSRVSLEVLCSRHPGYSYYDHYEYILQEMEKGRLRPLKASGTNGKRPALFLEYWQITEDRDFRELLEEIRYHLHRRISIDYYEKHPEQYEKERAAVRSLSDYLTKHEDRLACPLSVNERSFEIWKQEKFLSLGKGKTVLNHCGLTMEDLAVYRTSEPLAYYCHTRKTPQSILIIENKDTFYTFRKFMIDSSAITGNVRNENLIENPIEKPIQGSVEIPILGTPVGTLIYGAGKGIFRRFEDFRLSVEPYMLDPENRILYFGDLDYEGIGIFEGLREAYADVLDLVPFIPGYRKMLEKAGETTHLPPTKEGQNRSLSGNFFTFFSKEETGKMQQILETDHYIPQEIVNIQDLSCNSTCDYV